MSKARDLVIGYDPTAAVEPFTNQALIVEADPKVADTKVTGGATSDDYYETFSAGLAAAAAAQWRKSVTGGAAGPAPPTVDRAPADGGASPLTAHLLTLDYEEESYGDIPDDIGGCHAHDDDDDGELADINAALEGGEPSAALEGDAAPQAAPGDAAPQAAGLLDAVIAG